ncbi:MAG: hypothetical protein ACRBK7_03850 [Acidimicrobiales bacterium]
MSTFNRSLLALVLGFGLIAAACGSDSEDAATEEETSTAETETETEEATTTTEAAPEETAPAEAMSDGVVVDLGNPADGEFSLVLSENAFTAGETAFSVVNNGENPHAFAIARGTSYEDLPQKDNGAVDTEALGADYLGTTSNLQSGETEDISFGLEAGDYVFFCPVEFGPNSHAKAGQVLSVSVG